MEVLSDPYTWFSALIIVGVGFLASRLNKPYRRPKEDPYQTTAFGENGSVQRETED